MSQPLPPRLECVQCLTNGPGGCAAFTVRDIDPQLDILTLARHLPLCRSFVQYPASTLTSLTGRFPLNLQTRLMSFAVGDVHCRVSVFPWDLTTVCICGYALNAHSPSKSHAFTTPLPQWHAPSQLAFSSPPVDSIGHLLSPFAPPTQSQTNARRTSSASRTLPSNQGRVAAASAPHRGPRAPYPPALVAAGAAASGSSSAPPMVNPFVESTMETIAVLIWPHVLQGDHEPPAHPTWLFKIRLESLLDYILAFETHSLFFHAQVPRSGLASPSAFTEQLVNHLVAVHLQLTPAPRTAVHFHQQPFAVLKAETRNGLTTFKPYMAMNGNSFSLANFRKLNAKAPNPVIHTDQNRQVLNREPLIVICPRYGHIRGPITSPNFSQQDLPGQGRELPHPCFGARIVTRLPYEGRNNPDGECLIGHCLDGDDQVLNLSYSQPDVVPVNRPTTPAHESPVTVVNVDHGDPPPPPRPPVMGLMPLGTHTVSIAGETVEAVGECFIRLLVHLEDAKTNPSAEFHKPPKIT
ncbi:hypothetical protein DFH07DRAFT_971411 [Mycena maculata]|uniref:Uncharacterized protein n=1 Tax=Mycena maculata TaxID=230809 RepID=A0AAD7HN79_9AGAR|nr:hypothetical protein DFH07DRAFT_971411 [Mycena maculata]